MKRVIPILIIFILIVMLCLYGTTHPIFKFEKFDISKYEGENISLAFVEIVNWDINNHSYLVTCPTKEDVNAIRVICNRIFGVGDIVSFFGPVQDGKLYAVEYHMHSHPKASYYLSIPGLILLIFLFFREWKIEGLRFRRR